MPHHEHHHHHDEEAEAAYNQAGVQTGHKATLSHELIAAAASFAAMKAVNEHQKKSGQAVSHETAKEIMAAAAGAFVDRVVETKGHDFFDQQKAKHEAKARAESKLAY
ncbi:hypothetical protein BJ138DRAFT_1115493 [Hygrophoropsis aurantiaca]|uniref:Uncharacterized protein n=1 Tax=Hygrophoropsis aurantiaca TaxID=72124 RepID=A0ACB8A5Q2_9AGAM|nr:hypothetical protein BJ138DRAFT_1115493 [Hygrophoropsis aurantiaca]